MGKGERKAAMARGDELMTTVIHVFRQVWEVVRGVLGDNAYDRYTQSVLRRGGKPLKPEEFYLVQIRDKYSRPSRCC